MSLWFNIEPTRGPLIGSDETCFTKPTGHNNVLSMNAIRLLLLPRQQKQQFIKKAAQMLVWLLVLVLVTQNGTMQCSPEDGAGQTMNGQGECSVSVISHPQLKQPICSHMWEQEFVELYLFKFNESERLWDGVIGCLFLCLLIIYVYSYKKIITRRIRRQRSYPGIGKGEVLCECCLVSLTATCQIYIYLFKVLVYFNGALWL